MSVFPELPVCQCQYHKTTTRGAPMLEVKKHIGTLTNWTTDRHLQLITVVPSGGEHIG